MQQFEQIPMEPDFRNEVRRKYIIPLLRSGLWLSFVLGGICFLVIFNAVQERNYDLLFILIPFVLVGLVAFPRIYRYKRYYYKDFKLGYVIKEVVAITKVFDTPSGINIYWVSSDAIKTFVPDPYRRFREGDLLFIYYLRFSKEYLGYEC